MQERLLGTYDVLALARDTKANLEANKQDLMPYEIVIATDTNSLLFKTEQGQLENFFGGTGSDPTDQLVELVNKNTADIADNAANIATKADQKAFDDKSEEIRLSLDTKLERGNFLGTAEGLDNTKLDKGNFVGTAEDLIVKNNAFAIRRFDVKSNSTDNHSIGMSRNDAGWFWIGQQNNPTEKNPQFLRFYDDGKIRVNDQEIYTNANNTISKAQNGYCKLANGMIMQWGYIQSRSGFGKFDINFPISFSSGESYSISAQNENLGSNGGIDYIFSVCIPSGEKTASGIKNCSIGYRRPDNTYSSGGAIDPVWWIAMGY